MRFFVVFILAFFTSIAYSNSSSDYTVDTIAKDLSYPWSLAFLPNGDFLVSFRNGNLRKIKSDGSLSPPLGNTPKTYVKSQGGYFDVVLDPNFDQNKVIYLAFAYGTPEKNATRVVKATLGDDALENVEPIFTSEPWKNTPVHYGGRLAFMNDGTLVITTGDGFDFREAAQDPFSQLGKSIRIHTDGSVPGDNPFADGAKGNPKVYTLGHRSPQGLVIDPRNNALYLNEHGPKGGDEVNLLLSGKNYGWPATSYGINYTGAKVTPFQELKGIESPAHYWTPSIAPSGMALYTSGPFTEWENSLFVGALVNKEVRRLQLSNAEIVSEEALFSELDRRIRDVRVGPDGYVYLLTDHDDGELFRIRPK